MTIRTKDDHKVKMYENDIAELVDAVADQNVGRICWAARYLSEFADAICKIDIAEYEAEIERRRQIGLTIDPATAEMKFIWVDENDPYGVLEEQYQSKVLRREYFALHPDGTIGSLSRFAQSNTQSSVGPRRATDGHRRLRCRSRAPQADWTDD